MPTCDAAMSERVVEDMQAYYARRAVEYERIYAKPERQHELRALQTWLPSQFAGRRVLEIACGTGWWTPHAARDALDWLATDVNDETLAIAHTKSVPACVRFMRADAYALRDLPGAPFDAAFAGFWWSHVPRERLSAWLQTLRGQLKPGATVVFLDNRYVEGNSTPISRSDADGNTYQQRQLGDGSTHDVLKNFPTREEAMQATGATTRDADWIESAHFWVLACELN
jgi:ubiquinone/menaquinone biosynthesis C-methylase UbiE